MAKRDYYEVLGIEKSATEAEIKSAFKKAVKQYHPDLHPGDKAAEEKFKEANEAYEVLSDKDKRAMYDQFGHAAFDSSAGGAGGGYSSGGFSNFSDIGDIFETIFGGGFGSGFSANFGNYSSRQSRAKKGRTLRKKVDLTFEEAVFGTKKTISYNKETLCPSCSGSGAEPGTAKETCPRCKGKGQIHTQHNTPFGMMSSTVACDVCGGVGTVIKSPCKQCKGSGRVKKACTVEVNIPAGVDNGQYIVERGQGEPGYSGGANGDLQVVFNVKPHKKFVRDGYNLYQTVKIPFYTAALGGDINIEILTGSFPYTVKAGTQTGTKIRLKGKGVPVTNSSDVGDMIVTVEVDVPTKLTNEQRECIEKLAEVFGEASDEKKGPLNGILGKKKGKK